MRKSIDYRSAGLTSVISRPGRGHAHPSHPELSFRSINVNMPTFTFQVEHLDRPGSALRVRTHLNELPGVVAIDLNPATGMVRVDDDGTTERTQITLLLYQLGNPLAGTGITAGTTGQPTQP